MASNDITRIAGNIGALNALNSLSTINSQLSTAQTKLATGKEINSASDDPAGLSLATTFDINRSGLETTLSAIGDAKNLLSTAEGGLSSIQDILVKMKNKALEAQSDTIGDTEKEAIAAQLNAYTEEIDSIVSQTQWNGSDLIGTAGSAGGSTDSLDFLTSNNAVDGSYTTSFSFTSSQGFGAFGTGTAGLGLETTYTETNVDDTTILDNIQSAIDKVKTGISDVGSFSARLTFKEDALTSQYTNTEAAYSRIMDADMAKQQVESSKLSILQTTATSMLAQANSAPQFVLNLFQ